MDGLTAKVEDIASDVKDHEGRLRTLEGAVASIQHTLKDLEHPPRWVQTLLLAVLVIKEIVWPLFLAARGG